MKGALAQIVEEALASRVPVLALRGQDSLAREHGDLDFLVPKGRAVEACRLAAESARGQGWHLISFRDIGYLAAVILARPAGDRIVSIKLDFFSGLDWYGSGRSGLSDRFFTRLLPAAISDKERSALAGAVNFLQKSMTSGRLSERDLGRVRNAGATPGHVLETARLLELPVSVRAAETGKLSRAEKWRLRAASGGARGLVSGLAWATRAVASHIRFKMGFGTHAGLLLALGGLDGCGKSTQHAQLTQAYLDAGASGLMQVHLLPSWIPLPHQLLRRKATVQNYTRPYSEAPVTSPASATLRAVYYALAFLAAKVYLNWSVRRGAIVLMDRSFMDFVADLARARIPHRDLPGTVLRACAPLGCLVFLDASPAAVVARKGELTLEKATELRGRYRRVVDLIGGIPLDGDVSPSEVTRSLLQRIDRWCDARLSRVAT